MAFHNVDTLKLQTQNTIKVRLSNTKSAYRPGIPELYHFIAATRN
jgi:hypothetical protein